MPDLCLIRPANDVFALELGSWCGRLKSDIQKAGHSIGHDLYATTATRTAVEAAMSRARCTIFFGHGSYAELLGAGGALVDTANVTKARNSVVVAIACSSAKVLGPDAISQGVDVYLGFSEKFAWLFGDADKQFEPAAVSGVLALVRGGDAGQALAQMIAAFGNVKDYYLHGAGKGAINSTGGWLSAFWNSNHITLLGATSAKL
jgi:hypothetical protein